MGPAPPPQKSGTPGWLIALLVTLGLIVLALGVLGTLAFYGVHKYMAASALDSIGDMQREASSAYTRDAKLCASASSPVPASMSAVAGHEYMSNPGEWTRDPPDRGFTCLGFEMSYPQDYQYDYKETGTDSFVALAHGDLDGNGVTSEFSSGGHVAGGSLVFDTSVNQSNPQE